jgi:hypothetical protein
LEDSSEKLGRMEEEVWGGQGPNWAVEPYDDDDIYGINETECTKTRYLSQLNLVPDFTHCFRNISFSIILGSIAHPLNVPTKFM